MIDGHSRQTPQLSRPQNGVSSESGAPRWTESPCPQWEPGCSQAPPRLCPPGCDLLLVSLPRSIVSTQATCPGALMSRFTSRGRTKNLCLSIQLPSLYLRMLIIKNHSFMISRPEDLTTNPADHKQSSSNCTQRFVWADRQPLGNAALGALFASLVRSLGWGDPLEKEIAGSRSS